MPPIYHLPSELWLEVFSHLGYKDLCRLLAVCPHFNTLLQRPDNTSFSLCSDLDINFFRDTPQAKYQYTRGKYGFWNMYWLHPFLLSRGFVYWSREDNTIVIMAKSITVTPDELALDLARYPRVAMENAVSPALGDGRVYSCYYPADNEGRGMWRKVPAGVRGGVTVGNCIREFVARTAARDNASG